MPRPLHLRFARRAVEFGKDIVAALAGVFFLFDDHRVGLGIGILTDARDLPGDFDIGRVGSNRELMAADFASGDGLRELPDHREWVAKVSIKVSIKGLEPLRQLDNRLALRVGRGIAGDGVMEGSAHPGVMRAMARRVRIAELDRPLDPRQIPALRELIASGNRDDIRNNSEHSQENVE
jgi:hypothetical protein